MNRRWILLVPGVLVLLLISACASREAASLVIPERGAPNIKEGVKATEKEAWEVTWEKTLLAAKKEGKVVLYGSSSSPTIRDLAPEFKKKFGFELEVLAFDKGSALSARLLTERKAGLSMADVFSGGTNTFFGAVKPAGMADPMEPVLLLPEVVNPKNWYAGKLPWLDKEHMLFSYYAFANNTIAINSDLVKPDEIKSYHDLLNPKWKGKIIMNDPTISGVGLKSFSALGFAILNLDFFRQLARQEPMIIRDQRLQVDWLAKGKYHVLISPRPAPMMEFKRAGAPVAYGNPPIEGTYLSSGSALGLLSQVPHPNAAKIFINWFLSREGQIGMIPEGMQSSRLDVPTDDLDPSLVRQAGVIYFLDSDSEEWVSRDQEYTKAATDIFGHLIK